MMYSLDSQADRLPCDELDFRLPDGDVLLIVPPFTEWNYPSLACHLLQACAREVGIRVRIFYANFVFLNLLGEPIFSSILAKEYLSLLGERIFAKAAYGLTSADDPAPSDPPCESPNERDEFKSYEVKVSRMLASLVTAIARQDFKVVGCTSLFQQTSASVAFLNGIKRLRPDIVTIIGGANCEGEIAEGIASLQTGIDVIFSGESEATFPEFVQRILDGESPSTPIIYGSPYTDLDGLPTPDYSEYFEQLNHYLPGIQQRQRIWLTYETSRGCWWGQKHQCTFCGLNGTGMNFREKSPYRVIEELKTLVDHYPTRNILTTDNIMPYKYFQTLLPRLEAEIPDLYIHYEQKANLTLEKVVALKQAGVAEIQPGIEALSSSLLKRMEKGVSASQNIALLRYCRVMNLMAKWNLLYGFPGDEISEYEETLALLPLIRHLPPPYNLCSVVIDRFSPYFEYPEHYGVSNIRPADSYASVFPPWADINKLAYHFSADYRSNSSKGSDIAVRLAKEVAAWKASWNTADGRVPTLSVQRLSDNLFVLIDTRNLSGTDEMSILSLEEARVSLSGISSKQPVLIDWALARKLVIEMDGTYVPLAVADMELLREFETPQRAPVLNVLSKAAACKT